jgi:hypothetical protein
VENADKKLGIDLTKALRRLLGGSLPLKVKILVQIVISFPKKVESGGREAKFPKNRGPPPCICAL